MSGSAVKDGAASDVRDLRFWVSMILGLAVLALLFRRYLLLMVGAMMLVTTIACIVYVARVRREEMAILSARRLSRAWLSVLPFVVLTVFFQGRGQTGGTAFRYEGVHIARGPARSFGVAEPGEVDIALPRARDRGVAWQGEVAWRGGRPEVRFQRLSPGLMIMTCTPDVGQTSCEAWNLLAGSIISAGDSLPVPGRPPLYLFESDGQTQVRLGDATYTLGGTSDTIFTRATRLEEGAPLAVFRDAGSPIDPLADHITIRTSNPKEHVAERGIKSSWLRRANDARATRFMVQISKGAETEIAPLLIDRPTILRVVAGGEAWRLLIDPDAPLTTTRAGVALRFVRNPRWPIFNLTAPEACGASQACNIISLRTIPSPTNYFFLGTAGPDTLRYRFQARAEESSDSLLILTASRRYALEPNAQSLTAIAVESVNRNETSNLALLFSASRGALGSSWRALMAVGGIMLLFILISSLLMNLRIGARQPGVGNRSVQYSLTLVAAGLVTLALIRGILGLRVALYYPFYERTIQTGIVIWPALTTFLGILLISSEHPTSRQPHPTVMTAIRGQWRLMWATLRRTARPMMPSVEAGAGGYLTVSVAGLALLAFFGILGARSLVTGLLVGLGSATAFIGVRRALQVADRQDRPAKSVLLVAVMMWTTVMWATILPNGKWMAALATLMGVATMVLWLWRLLPSFIAKPDERGELIFAMMPIIAMIYLLKLGTDHNGAAANLFYVTVIVLLAMQIAGRSAGTAPLRHGTHVYGWFVVVAPLALLPLAVVDAGLLLVIALPFMVGAYVRADIFAHRPLWTMQKGVAMALLVFVFGTFYLKIIRQPAYSVGTTDPSTLVQEFERHSRLLGVSHPSIERLASRSVALHQPEVAMRLAVLAPGGAAQSTLLAAIEQHWGTKAYATGAGQFGAGIGSAPVGGRGIASSVSYAENTFAVYVLGEHGFWGGFVVLMAYVIILSGTAWYVAILYRRRARWNVAMESFVGATLLAIPAAYVAASNVGILPITGQNMPMLGLNAWSDVIFTCLAAGLIVQGIRHGSQPDLSAAARDRGKAAVRGEGGDR